MIAVNFKDFEEAVRLMQIITETIELLRDHKMTCYVKLAINKSDRTLSILNEHEERLRKTASLMEKHPEGVLEILKNLIFAVDCNYNSYELTLTESKIEELRDIFTFPNKKLQYNPRSIIMFIHIIISKKQEIIRVSLIPSFEHEKQDLVFTFASGQLCIS